MINSQLLVHLSVLEMPPGQYNIDSGACTFNDFEA